MHKILLTFLFIFLPLTAFSQKAFKPAKAALKAKNFKEVINQVGILRKDSTYRDVPQLCIFSIEAQRGLNDAENMKLYLKKNYDTIAFFSTTHQIIKEAVKLDSIERASQEKRKPKQAHFIYEQIQRYFPNLYVASRFFYKRKKFNEAMEYLQTCIDLPQTPLGKEVGISLKSESSAAALYLTAAFNAQQYAEVHRYDSLSLTDIASRLPVIECLIQTAQFEKDSVTYLKWVDTAWKEFPEQTLYFTRLIDFYVARGQYDCVKRIATEQLKKDSTDASALLAKCVAELNLMNLDECIENGKLLLQVDSANVEANYYIGASYAAKALQLKLPDNALKSDYKKAHEQQKSYYREAEPYLERYKELAPDSKNRWAPLLYKVYLGLNRGKKFAEIEKLL